MNVVEALRISKETGIAFSQPGAGWIKWDENHEYKIPARAIVSDEFHPTNALDQQEVECILNKRRWELKNWGKVWHRFYDDLVGESLLSVIPGERCSIHYHEHRHNTFIFKGEGVRIWTSQHPIPDDKYLDALADGSKRVKDTWNFLPHRSVSRTLRCKSREGRTTTIEPGVWHWFEVLEPTEIIEVYFTTDGTPVHQNDIVRFDEGRSLGNG